MCFGIPFIKFNYKEAIKKKNVVYSSIKPHLPYLTDEQRNKRERERYGAMADKALRTAEIDQQIKEGEKEEAERDEQLDDPMNQSVTFEVSVAFETS